VEVTLILTLFSSQLAGQTVNRVMHFSISTNDTTVSPFVKEVPYFLYLSIYSGTSPISCVTIRRCRPDRMRTEKKVVIAT
jgi:hypothetical protein